MKLPSPPGAIRRNRRLILEALGAAIILGWLMLYRLGNLTGGLSTGEVHAAVNPVGWHGMYKDAFYLPLNVLRSIDFSLFPSHGQFLTRLPNVILGTLSVLSFAALVRIWHGARIAALATALFAFSAWTLHVSRLASFDVVYLWGMSTLLSMHFLLRRYRDRQPMIYLSVVIWGLLLYVPGMVWLVGADLIMQRKFILEGLKSLKAWWQYLTVFLVALIWLPLLVIQLERHGGVRTWLGLPAHFDKGMALLKHFGSVPVHLFARGPEYPNLWLGRTPVLDIFTLGVCILGIYYYASHWRSARTRYLSVMALIGFVLVGINGPVGLSLLVPLLYLAAATGLAYLLHDWLKTFPNNPLARGLGLGLIFAAVMLSCAYNYRAYFVAWPHAQATRTAFHYRYHP